jgi:FkbM family methyltransferase
MKSMKARSLRLAWRDMKRVAAVFVSRGRHLQVAQTTSDPSPDPNAFLQKCKGVLHVGANLGQERDLYAQLGLPVIWFEALPSIFDELKSNLMEYPNQIAIQALLTDRDGEMYTFRVANNSGASSSILNMKYHRDIWPDVYYVEELNLKSTSLASALLSNGIDTSVYNALILDTQGSELLVLQGCGNFLDRIRFVKTEAADFEAYENCATVDTIDQFLSGKSFRLVRKDKFADHPDLGAYYDVLFKRVWRPKLPRVRFPVFCQWKPRRKLA